ncbi:DUF1090 domain-containing protein [Halomonas halocynthiae]|uniref:DUF1090 domain-containing protein n=1 Tax=Halomonas halocynthiae TaxID=176290 RepID=UPI000401A407|nr:DUF1090 domain-containing protein [Halomonas halocynthiae]
MKNVTRHVTTLLISAPPLVFSYSAFATENLEPLCQTKAEEIQAQLHIAEQDANEHHIRGLTKALEAVQEHCTNESVLADAEEAVRESLEEVQERQAELKSAQQKGDAKKIRRRSEKLNEAVAELQADQQELEVLFEQQ